MTCENSLSFPRAEYVFLRKFKMATRALRPAEIVIYEIFYIIFLYNISFSADFSWKTYFRSSSLVL